MKGKYSPSNNAPQNTGEGSSLLPGVLSDPSMQPLFTESVGNALSPDFTYVKKDNDGVASYDICASQTVQETGLINSDGERLSTTVWGYGSNQDNVSWPAHTIEAKSNEPLTITWRNKLEKDGVPLPHLLPLDPSLHWCYGLHSHKNVSIEKDGVPIVPHVHGAHVDSDSDGNPEYFFGLTEQSRGPRWVHEAYQYDNTQPAGALWYHDHALGITRLNVYAGLAGFYIIRDKLDTGKKR